MSYELNRDERGLTMREREVLDLLENGKTQIRIAEALGLTRQRVSAIVGSLRRKGAVNGS